MGDRNGPEHACLDFPEDRASKRYRIRACTSLERLIFFVFYKIRNTIVYYFKYIQRHVPMICLRILY